MTASLSPIRRFNSVDALRGITVAAMLIVNFPGNLDHIYPQLRHADWNGLTLADLIFPTFLFIAGVSISLSPVGAAQDQDQDQDQDARAAARRKILVRAGRILALAAAAALLSYFAMHLPAVRLWGVLQRIAVCYAAAALLSLYTSARTQWIVIAAILIAYAVILAIGGTAQWTNPADRLDAFLFGPMLLVYDAASGHGHDPEGMLTTLPAVATTLIGVRAGLWLKHERVDRLWRASAILMLFGLAWSFALPFNKNLWTPSFTIFVAGFSMLALITAHWLIDHHGFPALGRDFGRNAIVAYVGSELLALNLFIVGVWPTVYREGFAWMAPADHQELPSLLFAVAYVALWAVIVHVMRRLNWRITI